MTTWLAEISREMELNGESWSDVESCTLSQEDLDLVFNAGYGTSNGKAFGVWTTRRVYFPAVYDGSEWCASVAHHPSEPIGHIGVE